MKRHSAGSIFLFLLLMVTFAVAKGKSEQPAAGTVQEFTAAYNHKDVDKLVSLYAEDAIMVSEAGVAQGRDAIRARLSAGVRRGNTIDALHPENSDTGGNLSYTEGTAEVITSGQRAQRHYLVIVKKVGSHYQIVIHYSLPSAGTTGSLYSRPQPRFSPSELGLVRENLPKYDRNQNTGEPLAKTSNTAVAK
jgi:ketosteroid isomerase-like protein